MPANEFNPRTRYHYDIDDASLTISVDTRHCTDNLVKKTVVKVDSM